MSGFTIEVDESLCIHCGTCGRVCTRGNARVTPGTGDCGGCFQCYAVCPQKAVMVRNGATLEVPRGGSSIGFVPS